MNLAWSAVLAFGMAGLAWADDDDDLLERINRLEDKHQETELERLQRQAAKERQEELEGLPARVSKLEKGQATWDPAKMLSFSTPDGNFEPSVTSGPAPLAPRSGAGRSVEKQKSAR